MKFSINLLLFFIVMFGLFPLSVPSYATSVQDNDSTNVKLKLEGITNNNFANSKFDIQEELAYRVEFGGYLDVAYLLEKGGNPNMIKGNIPLVSIAAGRNDSESIKILDELVKAGGDLNYGGSHRLVPIILASRNGDTELMKYLLEKNVQVNITDRNGLSPYEIAKHEGHENILELISELVIKREDAERLRVSPETYKKHLSDVLFNRCGYEYTSYYYNNKMAIKPDNFLDIIAVFTDKVKFSSSELRGVFQVEEKQIIGMQEYSSQMIHDELVALISNRYRRKKGVGSPGDMEKRCANITEKWKQKFLVYNKVDK